MKVIISNGFNRCHLSAAAAQLHQRGNLDLFITAAYPTPGLRRLFRWTGLDRKPKIARLLDRAEALPDALVRSQPGSEVLNAVNLTIRRLGRARALQNGFFGNLGIRAYGTMARRHIRSRSADIYHYLSGYGHGSVETARQRGMRIVCDHAIPHPAVIQHLIDNAGRLPPSPIRHGLTVLRRAILADLERCDLLIVPSDFVKETFVSQGWDPARIRVVFFGLDDKFLANAPSRSPGPAHDSQPASFLFAGAWMTRKGAEQVAEAFQRIGDLSWNLNIAGGLEREVQQNAIEFLRHPRVRHLGVLLRADLAREMSKAEVFVFPSLSEGSARVITEAMACGCYVITTRNACGIVRDGVNGSVVPPWDAEALEKAIRFAIVNRSMVREIGKRNAELVRSRYRQTSYAEGLIEVYRDLLGQHQVHPEPMQSAG
jgi:glycosyltransferase involved in cell wall biosynthesis